MGRTRTARPPDEEGPPDATTEGAGRLDKAQAEFRKLLEASSVHSAQRRGAMAFDNTDVDSAYRHLLNPRERPFAVDVLAEFGLFLAGALVGYAITLLTAERPNSGPGWTLLLAAAFFGIF